MLKLPEWYNEKLFKRYYEHYYKHQLIYKYLLVHSHLHNSLFFHYTQSSEVLFKKYICHVCWYDVWLNSGAIHSKYFKNFNSYKSIIDTIYSIQTIFANNFSYDHMVSTWFGTRFTVSYNDNRIHDIHINFHHCFIDFIEKNTFLQLTEYGNHWNQCERVIVWLVNIQKKEKLASFRKEIWH